jgi:ABC-2 type transport system permease protein
MVMQPLETTIQPAGLGLLLRVKGRIVFNRVVQILSDSTLKIASTLALLLVIWVGLYFLFLTVFREFTRTLIESVVATQLIFSLFFGALLMMLTFSNAILSYGTLFSRREATYLLASPVHPRAVVGIKYLESLIISSWSLILLGIPMMLAMGQETVEHWYFYPFFIALFLGFIPIPAALGLVGAWMAARYLKRQLRRILIMMAVLAAVIAILGVMHEAQLAEGQIDRWLHDFLSRMEFLHSSLLPSTWVGRALERVIHRHHPGEAIGYLVTTISNGLFFSWLAIEFVSRHLTSAYGEALAGEGREHRRAANPAAAYMFFYLPPAMRLMAMKDLRTFLRDPMQWSQLAILFGLMVLYLVNVPPFHLELASSNWAWLVPHLNLCAVSFMLATFTSRFVFPMVSLEGHQIWLLGLLPWPRSWIAWSKFAFALTVTVPIGLGATALASMVLQVAWPWALVHLGVIVSTCVGLCGVSAGLGARMPSFRELNPARIANSLGGTVSLIVSVAVVIALLGGMTWVGLRSQQVGMNQKLDAIGVMLSLAVMSIGIAAGLGAMFYGARYVRQVEF